MGTASELWAFGRVRVLCALTTICFLTGAAVADPGSTRPPRVAADAGYRSNTFSSRFTAATIDLKDKRTPGYEWYAYILPGGKDADMKNVRLNAADKSVTVSESPANTVGALATAIPLFRARQPDKYYGQAFGGGGYFEAELKLDTSRASDRVIGHPGFWSIALEATMRPITSIWPGKAPDYANFIEPDFFEYPPYTGTLNYYWATLHAWSGVWNRTCPPGFCNVAPPGGWKVVNRNVPPNTDFNEFHRYGFLWIPATSHSDGRASWYFDGNRIGEDVTWKQHTDQPPDRNHWKEWSFGVLDKNHLVVIIGGGVNLPMVVKSVNVWQKSGDDNVVSK